MKKAPETFDTMANAAAGLGVSLDTVKLAKREGCNAFRNGRVIKSALVEWLRNRKPTEGDPKLKPLRDQKVEEEIRKLRIANDAKEKKLIERSRVCASIERLANRVNPMLEQKLEKEYPQAVAPTPEDIPRCRIIGANLCDSIRREFKSFADEWKQ